MPETQAQSIPPDSDSVLCVIQECLDEMVGRHVPISRETRIDKHFREKLANDSLEYLELTLDLEEKIGIWMTSDDWNFLTGRGLCKSDEEWEAKYGSLFTFGRLSDFLVSQVKLRKIEPITILGSHSLAAGAFRRIQEIALECDSRIKPFAPSTRISDRLHGRVLGYFWTRIRLLSRDQLPPLNRHPIKQWLDKIFGERGVSFGLGISLAIGWLICRQLGLIGAGDHWLYVFSVTLYAALVSVIGGSILFLILRAIYKLVMPREESINSRLPNNLRTFGDLAKVLAGERGGWCDNCGYDLTGLTSDRCPECGKPLHEPFAIGLPPKTASAMDSDHKK